MIIHESAAAARPASRDTRGEVLLVKTPYFTPLTPPLSLASLKAFLAPHGYRVTCVDYNADPDLWRMHHTYFTILQRLQSVSINDGYSKLWWILNAHMLARANGADAEQCRRILSTISPLYDVIIDPASQARLLMLVEDFYQRLAAIIRSHDLSRYAVVGTSTYTTSLGPSLFLLRTVKELNPRVTTVMGGGVFADDLALGSDNLDTLVRECPYVDRVVLGEGEELFLALLDGQLPDKRVVSIADLGRQTFDVSHVPTPDFSDFRIDSYLHLTVEGARSCPFQCSFCSETVQWGGYRKKPNELLVQQVMDLATRYRNNSFFMGDSLMNPYINPFATELIKRGARITYDGYLRADKPVANPAFAKLWADSGLQRVRLGIESASPAVLASMHKMTTPAVISAALKNLAAHGIRTTTYWIVGFPGETAEQFQETCAFIREHSPFIFELEAHPYYYYPYGQIGSRFYHSEPLYPAEVTDVIKFKVWDVVNVGPSRLERYDRLRRISALATSLGIPNIYTLEDRWTAERRWKALAGRGHLAKIRA
jgi:radical SAM superfamily enzyme YgiQ (UPF0313 family)